MERSEVLEKNKWKIEDIFTTDEAWEQAFEAVSKEVHFAQFAGKLGDRNTLLELLQSIDEFSIKVERLGLYAHMKRDEDTRISKYNAYIGKIGSLYARFSTELSFYEPEMSALSEDYLQTLLNDVDFKPYDYQLKRIIQNKPHVISQEEEKLVAMASESFSSFQEIFSMMNNADLPLPEIEWEGKTMKLTHGLYGVILHSNNREKREEAYNKYYKAFQDVLNTITATYHGNVKKNVFMAKTYKYDSCLERALSNEDVDRVVYDNLLEAVDKGFADLHRYIQDRKAILGYDKQYFYDVYTSLVEDVEVKLPYDEAYAYVIKGLEPLGAEYQALLQKGFDERWIDVEETTGKRSGAYSTGSFGCHPFVLLNYQTGINDMFTVAHEMGHSLHTYFSQANQPYAKSDYRIFVAEVASTVNEVLLLKYMVKNAEDINLKKYLLNYYLDQIRTTLFRQAMFAEFEYEAHTMVENGQPLTTENLCKVYAEIGKKYYGEGIEHDYNISCEWARIPHFYTAFYVYKYATGITTAINIANRILTEGQNAVDDYFKFLSGGSSTDPVSLLKMAGVDLTQKAPFEFAMKEFANTLTEFEKLMGL